jgi:hypothetical protein
MTSTTPPPQPPTSETAADATPRELLQFPVDFPIKVVGVNEDGLVHAITHIAEQFDPKFNAASVELRPSGGNKYLGVTITVHATSREQLDELYRALTTHPMVRWVL